MNILQRWLAGATQDEKGKLAKLAAITRENLRWVAGGYRSKGKVDISPELARRMELASIKIFRAGLEPLRREQLCQACGRCELAKAARQCEASHD
jgi:hypothetical protein